MRLYKLESFTIINNNYSIMIHNPCDIKNKNKPISEQTPYFMKIEKNILTKKFTNRPRKFKTRKNYNNFAKGRNNNFSSNYSR